MVNCHLALAESPLLFHVGLSLGILQRLHNIAGGFFKNNHGQVLVAYTCNLSYSGGRSQEDCVSKPVQANSS
jgi:hypothetical protein